MKMISYSFLLGLSVFGLAGYVRAGNDSGKLDRSAVKIVAATPVVTNDWFNYGEKSAGKMLDNDPQTSYVPVPFSLPNLFFRLETAESVAVGGIQLRQSSVSDSIMETWLRRTVQDGQGGDIADNETFTYFHRHPDGSPALAVFDAGDTDFLEFHAKTTEKNHVKSNGIARDIEIQEMKIYKPIPFGKLLKISGVTVTAAAGAFPGLPNERAVDGNLETEYASAQKGDKMYMTFDLGREVPVCGIRFYQRLDVPSIYGATLHFSKSEILAGEIRLPKSPQDLTMYCRQGKKMMTTVTFPPRSARYIYFDTISNGPGGACTGMTEIEFYTYGEGCTEEEIREFSEPLPPGTFRVTDATPAKECMVHGDHIDPERGSANLLDGNPDTAYWPIDGVEPDIEFDFQKPETVSGVGILQDPDISHATRGMILFPGPEDDPSRLEEIPAGPFKNGRSLSVFPAKTGRFMWLHLMGYSGEPQTVIQEVEFYSPIPSFRLKKVDSGEIDITGSAQCFMKNEAACGARNVLDGELSTQYASNGGGENTYIDFKFEGEEGKRICGFRHFQRPDPAQTLVSELIFNAGTGEETSVMVEMNAEHGKAAETFVTFPPLTAKTVRWQVRSILGNQTCQGASEIEFYEWRKKTCILLLK